jgi:hypothetical protein
MILGGSIILATLLMSLLDQNIANQTINKMGVGICMATMTLKFLNSSAAYVR